MAKRLCFIVLNEGSNLIKEQEIEFEFYTGFSREQKQKSIKSLHNRILSNNEHLNVLEVSSKSQHKIGQKLSAFNLNYYDKDMKRSFPVENIFQSSKVFENGGPYRDLLFSTPIEAKKDARLKDSGELRFFKFKDNLWDIEPKTFFYDWIYISALIQHKELFVDLLNFNCFTDIEFNHMKSINCQARSVAIFVSLYKRNLIQGGELDLLMLKSYYKINTMHQISFDL